MAKMKSPRAASAPAHLRERVKSLQSRLRKQKCDSLLVSNPVDIRYLTNFVGEDSCAVIPATGSKVHILSDFRFTTELKRDSPHTVHHIRSGSMVDAIKMMREEFGFRKIGLQPNHVSIAMKKQLDKKCGPRGTKAIKDGLLDQRAVKNDEEVKLLTRAGDIQCKALRETLKHVKPGMTELQIMSMLHYEMGKLGAEGPAFGTIVAADGNAAMCHYQPRPTKVKKNGILLIDWGAKYNGYHSDMTRTFAFGKFPKKVEEIYKIVLDAQLAAIDAIRPGVQLKALDKVARDIIDDAGYGAYYGHGLGHGIGLQIHEAPGIGKKSKGELKAGQVITIEPGIYLPDVGGVRIEDDVLVTARGKKVLTNFPKGLKDCVL